MQPAISVKGVGKQYRIGAREEAYRTLREAIVDTMTAPIRRLRQLGNPVASSDMIWALKDVSFDVQPGEVIGLIGRNGAGKSTLLKILSRITEPTQGRIELRGRVASLLEVGTGFHPELTGRENIYLNGVILGMKKAEIDRKFDEIVAFAEIEKFLDTPVKHYSSGMYVRLAFAVAAHLEPEILLVDEVLAVGDAQFQKKCLGKMGEVAKEGRTVLFVSHNMAAVENLCQRGIVLDRGRVEFVGDQTGAVARYLSGVGAGLRSLRDSTNHLGTGNVRIVAIEMRDVRGALLDVATSGQTVDIYLHYEMTAGHHTSKVIASLAVRTYLDVPVFLQHNRLTGQEFGALPPRGAFVCRVARLPLPPATYRLGYSLIVNEECLDAMSDAAELTVVGGRFYRSGEVPPIDHGCCLVDADWRVEPNAMVCLVEQISFATEQQGPQG
jgi:lipopolysaccharide transport system ATP-binding protein